MERSLDEIRDSIVFTLSEIQLTQARLGLPCDPADREAYDIVCRIERRLMSKSAKPAALLNAKEA